MYEALKQQGVSPGVHFTSVLAGEKSGNLYGVPPTTPPPPLELLHSPTDVWFTWMRKKLIATLIYPTILVCAATLIGRYWSPTTVIPNFALLYGDLNINIPAANILLCDPSTYRPFLLAGIGIMVVLRWVASPWSGTLREGCVGAGCE